VNRTVPLLLLIVLGYCSLGLVKTSTKKPAVYTITLKITAIRNKSGRIQLQVYRDQKNFAKQTPLKVYHISKKDVKDHYLIYQLTGFSPGTYGLALLDDEDSDSKMDYGLVMPKEGFGFSDYYHTGWSSPKFDDFKFELRADKSIKIQIRYL